MRLSSLIGCLMIFAPAAGLAGTQGVTICLVQTSENRGEIARSAGQDARNLSRYLDSETLPNGTPIYSYRYRWRPPGRR
jgi:hypothetical protein